MWNLRSSRIKRIRINGYWFNRPGSGRFLFSVHQFIHIGATLPDFADLRMVFYDPESGGWGYLFAAEGFVSGCFHGDFGASKTYAEVGMAGHRRTELNTNFKELIQDPFPDIIFPNMRLIQRGYKLLLTVLLFGGSALLSGARNVLPISILNPAPSTTGPVTRDLLPAMARISFLFLHPALCPAGIP